jgi:hypothetical protein
MGAGGLATGVARATPAAAKFYGEDALRGMRDFRLADYADQLARVAGTIVAFASRDGLKQWIPFLAANYRSVDVHVWHKPNAIPFTNNTWKSDVEYLLLGSRYCKHQYVPQHEKSKVFTARTVQRKSHPTQKPLPLIEKYVRILTAPGELVVDPFAGSGTTLVACVNHGRRGIGVEKLKKYCRIAAERVEAAAAALRSPATRP